VTACGALSGTVELLKASKIIDSVFKSSSALMLALIDTLSDNRG